MTKILFVGDLNKYGRSYRRFKTLRYLHYELIGLSHTFVSTDNKIKAPSLKYRLFNKLMFPLDVNNVNKNILLTINNKKVDIVWIENGVTIYPSTLRFIKKKFPKIKIVALSEDDMCKSHNQSFWYLFGLKYYDLVFTTKSHNLNCLSKIGAKEVVIFYDSFDSSLHKIYSKSNYNRYKYNVSHIGAFEKDRSEYLHYLAKNGVKVNIWGNGWEKCKLNHSNLNINHEFLYEKNYPQTIFKSRINLNFLRKINEDVITSRSLEIPASGGFMLAEKTEAQTKIFQERIEADYFSSKEELLKKTLYYLSNEKIRKTVEQNGYNKCIRSQFSMISQMRMILRKIFQLGS